MSYAIFRVAGRGKTTDLQGAYKHNVERISRTNEDIDHTKSNQNIELVSLGGMTYREKFDLITADMKAEHEESQKKVRKDRKKSFERKLNDSKNNVAAEFLFTSDSSFFEGMDREDIQKWAETSLAFVTDDLGISKDNIIHAVVHMDEKTPHLHVMAVPLVKKYDKRAKREKTSISLSYYTKDDREHMSHLQDVYHAKMVSKGFTLERGEKGSKSKNKGILDLKIEKRKEELVQLEQSESAMNTNLDEIKRKREILIKENGELQTVLDLKQKRITDSIETIKRLEKIEKLTENVQEKKSLLGKENTVVLPKSDFDKLVNHTKFYADASVKYKRKAQAFFDKNDELSRQNGEFKSLNGSLQRENDKLREENKKLKSENKNLWDSLSDFLGQNNLIVKFHDWMEKRRLEKEKEKPLIVQKKEMVKRNRKDFGL